MTYMIPSSPNAILPTPADVQHLEIERGSDYMFTYAYKDPLTGLPISLLGSSASLTVVSRKSPAGGTLISKSLGSGIVFNTAANGIIEVSFLPADTSSQDDPSLAYDLYIVPPSGHITKILKGFITIVDTAG